MKKISLILSTFLILVFMSWLSVPSPAHAVPDIDVIPMDIDFGEVEVSTSSTAIITISNVGGHDLVVSDISFKDGSSLDFTITSMPSMPAIIPPPDGQVESIEVEVTFSPSDSGYSMAVLQIASNDEDEEIVEVLLAGMGVEVVVTIEDILDYFDESVAEGTLEGRGYRLWVKKSRLKAMRVMLVAAGELIERGRIGLACKVLNRAYNRCDGEPWPPDFVIGEARTRLADMILDLGENLGCK
ncbi:MAG: choice-of-anchor D domain-containing protein [Proteobacteria bacterium]|nr:choice-of-anchor D domain-containing protein [Pseudomonadota bacterium]